MPSIHASAVVVSIFVLLTGSFGFLQKKLNVWISFVLISFVVCLFFFGVLPSHVPDWSFSRQVIYMILVSITGFVVIGSMLKYILTKKGH